MSDPAFYKKWKNELTHYSVYVEATTALLIALAVLVIAFIHYQTFYLATMVGGVFSGIFGIITVMAQDSQSRKRVARISVDVVPGIHSNDPSFQTGRVNLKLVQMNRGVRAGNKVMTFIRLYVKVVQGMNLPNFRATEGLVDISDVNHCPFPAEDCQIMIKVFESKPDPFGVRYPGINVPIGEIGFDKDFFKNYDALTLEADTYEEYTHFNLKFLISGKYPSKEPFPTIKVLSEKFERY